MVKILSLSIDEETESELESLKKDLNLEGRSETIRAAIKSLSLENKNTNIKKGKISAILVIIHNHNYTPKTHFPQSLIKTHIHNHIQDEKCLNIYILEGGSSQIKKIHQNLQKDKKIKSLKLLIV